jgi:membrane-bound ClpP family serine protease
MPIATYYSNYQANWIFLIILAAVIIFLEAKFYESPFKAWAFAGGATLVLCLIGGYFDWITGLPLLVIEVVLAIVTLWRYKEELML